MTVKREETETQRGSRTVPPAGEPVTVTTTAEQRRQEEQRRREALERNPHTPIRPTEQ